MNGTKHERTFFISVKQGFASVFEKNEISDYPIFDRVKSAVNENVVIARVESQKKTKENYVGKPRG